jgi:hypothetical protein
MLKVATKKVCCLRAWILSFVVLAVIWSIVNTSQPFQECINETYYNPATENFEESIPSFSFAFGVYRDCLGAFTHDNAEAIIAAFTIILALSTIFLWVATRDLVTGTAPRGGNCGLTLAHRSRRKFVALWKKGHL